MSRPMLLRWERHLLSRFLWLLLLAITGIVVLYVTLDYTTHLKSFSKHQIPLNATAYYYFTQVIKRSPLLAPCSLMIAALIAFHQLVRRGELLVLITSGYSLRQVLRGPLLISGLLSALLYLSAQWIEPQALRYSAYFEKQFFHSNMQNQPSNRFLGSKGLHILSLTNGGYGIYQWYDEREQQFHDLYLFPNEETLFHVQQLKLLSNGDALASKIDTFHKKEDGFYYLSQRNEEKRFQQLNLHDTLLEEQLVSLDFLSLSQLASDDSLPPSIYGYQQRGFSKKALLAYKLILPLFSILSILLPGQFLLKAKRTKSPLYLYLVSFFLLLSTMMLTNTIYLLTDAGMLYHGTLLGSFLLCWGLLSLFLYLRLGPLVHKTRIN
jgi:lipopolysaccharide export LptBFGC system permease protein LptF